MENILEGHDGREVARPSWAELGPGWAALEARDDLLKFKPGNAIGLFALELTFGTDDIESVAFECMTDGGNDKKCDLVYFDRETATVVVAQCYASMNLPAKAPANKASDLNTAISWLLTGDVEKLPPTLKSAAKEVREALSLGEVRALHIWSTHNARADANVTTELKQAVRTADRIIRQDFADTDVNVDHAQIGEAEVNSLYNRSRVPILVADPFKFPIEGGYVHEASSWKSFSTSVQLDTLRELWKKYGTDLMSPNVRDYLGIVKSENNINFGIKKTARTTPEDFFIFNNGLTAVVNSFEILEEGRTLAVDGLGIVNGGQTTGAIGTLTDDEASHLSSGRVAVRFITSQDTAVIEGIVRYNNTQNKVNSVDFRSNDPVQGRLRQEFEFIPNAEYRGGRRGGGQDAIARNRAVLADDIVAKSLASFHGQPNTAYNEFGKIWEKDATYARYFNEHTTARHIVATYGLYRAVENLKKQVREIPEVDRKKADVERYRFFSTRGSIPLYASAVAGCVELILDRKVESNFDFKFRKHTSPEAATALWKPVVERLSSAVSRLTPATDQGLKSDERVQEALRAFREVVEMFLGEAEDSERSVPFERFRQSVDI